MPKEIFRIWSLLYGISQIVTKRNTFRHLVNPSKFQNQKAINEQHRELLNVLSSRSTKKANRAKDQKKKAQVLKKYGQLHDDAVGDERCRPFDVSTASTGNSRTISHYPLWLSPIELNAVAALSSQVKGIWDLWKLRRSIKRNNDPLLEEMEAQYRSRLEAVASVEHLNKVILSISFGWIFTIYGATIQSAIQKTLQLWSTRSNSKELNKALKMAHSDTSYVLIKKPKLSDVLYKMHASSGAYSKAIARADNKYYTLKANDILSTNEWKQQYKAKGDSSLLRIPLSGKNINYIVGNIPDSDLRYNVYKYFHDQYKSKQLDTLVMEILKCRKIIAEEMGYSCWAEFSVNRRTVEGAHFDQLPSFFNCTASALKPLTNEYIGNTIFKYGQFFISNYPAFRDAAQSKKRQSAIPDPKSVLSYTDWMFVSARSNEALCNKSLPTFFHPEKTLDHLLDSLATLYSIKLAPVKLSRFTLSGWPASTRCYGVYDFMIEAFIGYVYICPYVQVHWEHYVNLKSITTSVPHTITIAPGHVLVNCEYLPSLLEGKACYLTAHQVFSTCHEMGHALHFLYSTYHSKEWMEHINHPLDIAETFPTLHELYYGNDIAMRFLGSGNSMGHTKTALRFGNDLNRLMHTNGVLVKSVLDFDLHSDKFDPNAASFDDLIPFAKASAERYSPWHYDEGWSVHAGGMLSQITGGFYSGAMSSYLLAIFRAVIIQKRLHLSYSSKKTLDSAASNLLKHGYMNDFSTENEFSVVQAVVNNTLNATDNDTTAVEDSLIRTFVKAHKLDLY